MYDLDIATQSESAIGLKNIEDRLARVYGRAAALRLSSLPEVGTTAELRVPFTRSAASDVGADTTLTVK